MEGREREDLESIVEGRERAAMPREEEDRGGKEIPFDWQDQLK